MLGVTKCSLCNHKVILKRQQNQMPSIERQTLKTNIPCFCDTKHDRSFWSIAHVKGATNIQVGTTNLQWTTVTFEVYQFWTERFLRSLCCMMNIKSLSRIVLKRKHKLLNSFCIFVPSCSNPINKHRPSMGQPYNL